MIITAIVNPFSARQVIQVFDGNAQIDKMEASFGSYAKMIYFFAQKYNTNKIKMFGPSKEYLNKIASDLNFNATEYGLSKLDIEVFPEKMKTEVY